MKWRGAGWACIALLAAALDAQPPAGVSPAPAAMRNNGAPIRLEFACTDQDMTAAGLDCTADKPCAVYLELSAVEAVGGRIFAAGNLHTDSATLRSVLLVSPDQGQSWTEPYERIGGAVIDQLSFFDDRTGWAGGHLVRPLPRDPFLLVTTDSGDTWKRTEVFSEGRSGAIDRLQFVSAADGWLWIDRSQSGDEGARFERWETTTGGATWTLREALNRLPPAPPPARSAGWRLTTDPATRSYRIERRAGAQWETVAAFLISIGECRRALEAIPAPPPEPPEPEPVKTAPRSGRN